MQYQDLMLSGIIFQAANTLIESMKTGNIAIDLVISFFSIILLNLMCDGKFSSKFIEFFTNWYGNNFIEKRKGELLFPSKKGACSQSFRSLLKYLSNNPSKKGIRSLVEDLNTKFDRWGDWTEGIGRESISTIYRVNQPEKFNFTDDIYGRIYTEEKEKESTGNGGVRYEELVYLEVFSLKRSTEELQDFVNKCVEDYKKSIKDKMIQSQSLIKVESSTKPKVGGDDVCSDDLLIKKSEWYSPKTFDNIFFPEVKNVIKKIEFFIQNREWYEKRGLPWTLGIMLSGIPGSGKTSFIKALMNYTKRHCIRVVIDDDFKMSELEDIISDEEVDDDIIIPIDRRIIVIEDIDAMGDLVKDRDLKDSEKKTESEKEEENKLTSELIKAVQNDTIPLSAADLLKKDNKFSLSKLLNIIDGLDEHSGRIMIITTNKPEKLDKALTRPGRIDISIKFDYTVEDDIHNILNHFWEKDTEESIKPDLSKYDKKFSAAEIINFCRNSSSYEDSITLIEENFQEKLEKISEGV